MYKKHPERIDIRGPSLGTSPAVRVRLFQEEFRRRISQRVLSADTRRGHILIRKLLNDGTEPKIREQRVSRVRNEDVVLERRQQCKGEGRVKELMYAFQIPMNESSDIVKEGHGLGDLLDLQFLIYMSALA